MKKTLIYLALLFLFAASFVSAEGNVGTIDGTNKYAWSNNAGWINFGCDNCDLQITDTKLTGYAWSQNFGWISFDCSNDGGSCSNNWGVRNNGSGVLSGSAWGENTGWVDFGGVSINSEGQFTGVATGSVVGSVNFSCEEPGCPVTTDWRKTDNSGSVLNNNGVPSFAPPPPAMEISYNFSAIINNGAEFTNNPVVTLTLSTDADVSQVQISTSSNLVGAVAEPFETTKNVVLSGSDGTKTLYVRFILKSGQLSEIIPASIELRTEKPDLVIDKNTGTWLKDESVTISGESVPNAEIMFAWDNKYGIAKADANGNWNADFSVMPPGENLVTVTAKDNYGNTKTSETVVKVEVPVDELFRIKKDTLAGSSGGYSNFNPGTFLKGIMKDISENIGSKIDSFASQKPKPQLVISVPKETPEVLKNKWKLILLKNKTK